MRMALILSAMALVLSSAFADAPLPPPSDLEVYSANKKYVAVLKHKEKTTSVFSIQSGGERQKLWEMSGWFRWTALSDDGEYLAIPYWGANLLTLDYIQDDVMLTLVKRGKTVATFCLSDFIDDYSKLKKTVSHYYWGDYVGFNEKNEYVIKTVEGNHFFVSLIDGNMRKEKITRNLGNPADKR